MSLSRTQVFTVKMANPFVRLSYESESTWAAFHRRVSALPFNYAEIFPRLSLHLWIERQSRSEAASVTRVPSMLTAITFLLADNDAHFLHGSHLQALNIYTMTVGHVGTGKSPAVETVLVALRDIDYINRDTLASATTSCGLVKTIFKQGKAFLASPELFDILNKLQKWPCIL